MARDGGAVELVGSAGTDGAAQGFLAWHQDSQEATAARLRVAGELVPHNSASALPISVSEISASGRSRLNRAATFGALLMSATGGCSPSRSA
ncbi:hypothetical protein [Nonomuraea turkmeniaca]|uniref:hypothetical protein n=1 Tax=Nonomuraea turkmeniaca TaxID=103838 RepID=UPI001477238D|nr:hypothetical protein [Nonomuraea turkmeniaca]